MALADAVQGATRPTQTITWQLGVADVLNLTDATLSGTVRPLGDNLAVRAIAGTLTVTDGAAGEFEWAYHADDVADAGYFLVQFTATFALAPTIARSPLHDWTVRVTQEVSP